LFWSIFVCPWALAANRQIDPNLVTEDGATALAMAAQEAGRHKAGCVEVPRLSLRACFVWHRPVWRCMAKKQSETAEEQKNSRRL